jgi:hypothetical protein
MRDRKVLFGFVLFFALAMCGQGFSQDCADGTCSVAPRANGPVASVVRPVASTVRTTVGATVGFTQRAVVAVTSPVRRVLFHRRSCCRR